jgi:hypothetical protein
MVMRKFNKGVTTLAVVTAMVFGATLTASAQTGDNEASVVQWIKDKGYTEYSEFAADQFLNTPGDITDEEVTQLEATITDAKTLYDQIKDGAEENNTANRTKLVEYAQTAAGIAGGAVISFADQESVIDEAAVFVSYRYDDNGKVAGISKLLYGNGTEYKATALITVEGTEYAVVEGSTPTTTGAYEIGGTKYYVDGTTGTVDTTYTGLAKYNGTLYYFSKGVESKVTGLIKNTSGNGKWYYVSEGTFFKYNGISKIAGNAKSAFYYVKGGVKQDSTGLVKNTSGNGKWYYVSKGVFNNYTGLVKIAGSSSNTLYYVKSGVLTSVTGLVKNTSGNGKWYYVSNGVFKSYTGIAKIAGNSKSAWYAVKGGVIASSYTGLIKNGSNGKWYYIKGGKFNNYTGTVKYNGHNYKVKNGVKQ